MVAFCEPVNSDALQRVISEMKGGSFLKWAYEKNLIIL